MTAHAKNNGIHGDRDFLPALDDGEQAPYLTVTTTAPATTTDTGAKLATEELDKCCDSQVTQITIDV